MADSAESRPGWRALLGAGRLPRLAIICFGVWLHAADGLLISTMMPSIIADIGGADFVPWTFALYEVGSIAAGAASALLAMRHGLRRAMATAALVYLAGCIMSAVAPAMSLMLAGRLAQGLGGGGLMALSFVAIGSQFPRSLMPQVMAAVSMLWGVSAFLGPLVGGGFVALGSWRGGFWVFAAQAGLLAAGVLAWLAEPAAAPAKGSERRLPLRRLALLALGVILIAAGGIDVSPLRTALCVLAGCGLIGLFLRMDGRHEHDRLLPLRALDPRSRVGAGLLMVLCFSAATVALGIYGPLLMTRLYGISALVAGYIIALSSIGWSVTAVVIANAAERYDARLIVGGMVVLTLSIAGLMLAMPGGPLWLVGLFALAEGAGFGVAWTFILRRATALASGSEADRIASALPTIQRLGYALGAAYAGIVANATGFAAVPERTTDAAVAFWIFAASLPVAGVGLFAAWRFVRGGGAIQPSAAAAPGPGAVSSPRPAHPD